MNTASFKKFSAILAPIVICLLSANATPTMRLSADGGVTWTVVEDNGGLDTSPAAGVVTYEGPVGGWTVSITSGFGSPALGSQTTPSMDLSTVNVSSGPASLIVQMSDVNFVPFPNETFISSISLNTGGTVTYNTYRDSGNVLFGTTESYPSDPAGISPSSTSATLMDAGPFANGAFYSSNSIVVPNGGISPFSLTLETIITHTDAAQAETFSDASLVTLAPPACNCTLTFTSPSFITNCAGDVIPDVTASQNCGGTSYSTPVTFLGAATNGTCPQIITRTNSAMDSCGTSYTNVQTITLNCRGSICGHVFADCDGSGDLSAGDVGLAKIVVSLLDASGKVVATQITDSNGGYCFINLAGGSYTVSVTPPSGYSQTAASTSYHWKDGYGRICWQENDGYIHCLSNGTECWWDKSNCCHWKDSYGRDCWKDNWGSTHCQPCSYQNCNAQTYNNKISVTLANCGSQSDVDFAYTGTKCAATCTVSCPTYVKCGQSCTFTCTVCNNGNACFTGGTVCHVIGNCGGWSGWNNCTTVYDKCPPLSPGQSCTFTHKCTFNYWNCGTVGCQSTVTCSSKSGNTSCQSTCYSQCGW